MISVCLTSFNGSQYIVEQLQSILEQLSEHDEIIVADDGSTDNTLALVCTLADTRIKLLSPSNRLGVIKNFERALQAAKGDIIFLSDQDDVWLPGKITDCRAELANNLLVITDCKVVNQQLEIIYTSFFQHRHSAPGIMHNLKRNSYLGCCMAFRKELLSYALPFSKHLPMHDMWLGMIAEIYGNVKFITKPYVLYRRHEQNLSFTAEKSNFNMFQKARFRIVLAYLLVYRVLVNYKDTCNNIAS